MLFNALKCIEFIYWKTNEDGYVYYLDFIKEVQIAG